MDEEKKEQQEEMKEGVTKAFGNEEPAKETADPKATEQKESDHEQEGAESASEDKKQSGKTYTQAEVDAMMAKARKKYSKNDGQEEAPTNTSADESKEEPSKTQDLATGITVERLAQAELKAEMAILGVEPSKVSRAVRLIDINEVLDNGQYSDTKAKEAIESLMQEWPELMQSKAENNENQFYFGVPGQEEQQDKDKQKSVISSIFGN